MKKTGMVCVLVLGLAMLGHSSEPLDDEDDWGLIGYLDYLETFKKERFESLRKDYNDVAKLRAYFEEGLLRTSHRNKEMLVFKQKFGISDKTMLAALMGIIRETAAKTEWKWGKAREDSYDINWRLLAAVRWLGVCADAEAKQFLMGIATDKEKDSELRKTAIEAYLRRADAQEAQGAITRFVADDMRITTKPYETYPVSFCVYANAFHAYNEAQEGSEKRKAIISALSDLLPKEKNMNDFDEMDKWLADQSREYAESPQRKAALERMNKPPEKETP